MRFDELRPPDPEAAEERAWRIARNAFSDREPVPRRSHGGPLAAVVVLTLVLAVVAATLSPPGRAVVDHVRRVVGVERAAPALFSLPTAGRLLVASDPGVWVVDSDGKKRLLAGYREASWSPFGRFIVAARRNELAALEPDGAVRWTLARPGASSPRWTGTATDTRIAYLDRSGIRIVAGDGAGDRLLVPAETGPIAWRAGSSQELAYVSASEVRLQDVDTGRVLWRATFGLNEPVRRFAWSTDGKRLLVVAEHGLRVYDDRGRLVAQDDPSGASTDRDAAFVPGTHQVAVLRDSGSVNEVFMLSGGRKLFTVPGELEQLVAAPNGSTLLATWPDADQWVLVRRGGKRLRAVANVSAQFRSRTFPRVEGWCCEG